METAIAATLPPLCAAKVVSSCLRMARGECHRTECVITRFQGADGLAPLPEAVGAIWRCLWEEGYPGDGAGLDWMTAEHLADILSRTTDEVADALRDPRAMVATLLNLYPHREAV